MGFQSVLSILTLFAIGMTSVTALATPSTFNVDGVITKSSGVALEESNVVFTVNILAPASGASCLLYQESFTVNMTGSNGYFALQVGKGTNTAAGSYILSKVFSSGSVLTGLSGCSSGTAYTAGITDDRQIVISFIDSAGNHSFTSHNIEAVPFAVQAKSSSDVGGYGSGQLLKVDTSVNQTTYANAALSQAQYDEFWKLIGGTSTLYAPAGGSNLTATTPLSISGGTNPVITLPQAGTSSSGYLSATDWGAFNNKMSSALSSGNIFVGGVSGVAASVPLSGDATISNSGALSLATITTASTQGTASAVPIITVDAKGRVTALSTATVNATLISGYSVNIGSTPTDGEVLTWNAGSGAWIHAPLSIVPESANIAGAVVTRDAVGAFAAGAVTVNSLKLFDGSSGNVTFSSGTPSTASYLMRMPTSIPAVDQVMSASSVSGSTVTNSWKDVTILPAANSIAYRDTGGNLAANSFKLPNAGTISAGAVSGSLMAKNFSEGFTDLGNTNFVDFTQGNVIKVDADCSATLSLNNMIVGATYTLLVNSATTTMCTFTGGSGETIKFSAANANALRSGSQTVYEFKKIQTWIFVRWMTGY